MANTPRDPESIRPGNDALFAAFHPGVCLRIENIDDGFVDERGDRGTHTVRDGGTPHSSAEADRVERRVLPRAATMAQERAESLKDQPCVVDALSERVLSAGWVCE